MENDPGDTRFLVENLARSGQALAVTFRDDVRAKSILQGYIRYLLGEKPRNYGALADYLGWWGENFLWEDIESLMRGFRYSRIFELGPGTGWLLKKLAHQGEKLFAIDKRWQLINRTDGFNFRIQDLEHIPLIAEDLQAGDLIVANQFLHCVDNREDIVRINRATWLVIELASDTWMQQIKEFGATPLNGVEVESLFRMSGYRLVDRRKSTVVVISLWGPA